jgi:hypothetical protein
MTRVVKSQLFGASAVNADFRLTNPNDGWGVAG